MTPDWYVSMQGKVGDEAADSKKISAETLAYFNSFKQLHVAAIDPYGPISSVRSHTFSMRK